MNLRLYLTALEQRPIRALAGAVVHSVLPLVRRVVDAPRGQVGFLPTDGLAWTTLLEDSFEAIRAEAVSFIDQRDSLACPLEKGYGGEEGAKGDWHIFQFLWLGQFHSDAPVRCPATTAVLRRIPGLRTASFSLLGPNERIPLHAHPTIRHRIFHLGIQIPQEEGKCQIRVADSVSSWEEGKILLFDPSLPHEVWNLSSEVRVILVGEVGTPFFSRWRRPRLPIG